MNNTILTLCATFCLWQGFSSCDEDASAKPSTNEIGTKYGSLLDSYIKSRRAFPAEVYDFLLAYVKKDEPILDIGCGTGLSTAQLIMRFDNVIGGDIDEKMLVEARKLDPNLFDLADIYNLPYPDESFALITAFDMFHRCCDQNSAKEIARVLQPNGFFYTVVPVQFYTETSFRGKVAKVIEALGVSFQDSKKNYHPEEVLSQNGFEIIYTANMVLERSYTAEEALDRLKGSCDIWIPVLEAGKEKEAMELLKELIMANLDENGKVTETYKINLVFAKKKSPL